MTRQPLLPCCPVLRSSNPPADFSFGNSSSNFWQNSVNLAFEWKQIFLLPRLPACNSNFSALEGTLSWPFRAQQKNSWVQVSLGFVKKISRCFYFDGLCLCCCKVDMRGTRGTWLYGAKILRKLFKTAFAPTCPGTTAARVSFASSWFSDSNVVTSLSKRMAFALLVTSFRSS